MRIRLVRSSLETSTHQEWAGVVKELRSVPAGWLVHRKQFCKQKWSSVGVQADEIPRMQDVWRWNCDKRTMEKELQTAQLMGRRRSLKCNK